MPIDALRRREPLDVIEALYNYFLDYRTGRLVPSVTTISAQVRRGANCAARRLG